MLLSIPPKFAVSEVVGHIKGKSAIHMARIIQRFLSTTNMVRSGGAGEKNLKPAHKVRSLGFFAL